MAALTNEGYKNIKESIINEESLKVVENKLVDYYVSIEEKKGNTVTQETRDNISKKVKDVMEITKYTVIPTKIEEFNLNNFISKQKNLTSEQQAGIINNSQNIVATCNNNMQIKIFNQATVEAFGFKMEDIYVKEPGKYFPTSGPKYDEFYSLVQSTVFANTDPSINTDNEYEHNVGVISQETGSGRNTIQNRFSQLQYSGGFCNQDSFYKIDIVLNASKDTAVSSVFHETLHAMSYYDYDHGYESGFNTEREKSQYGYRKNQLFNEVVNEFLTQKVVSTLTEEDYSKFGIKKQSKNIYQDLIPLVEDMLEKNETLIVDCLNSGNPMQFKEIIGKENFDSIVENLNTIQGKFDQKYYDGSTLLDHLENKIKQDPNNSLGDDKISIKYVKENIDYIKSVVPDKEISDILDNITNLGNTCKKVNESELGSVKIEEAELGDE